MKRNIKITLIVCLLWVFFVMLLTYSRYANNNQSSRGVSSEELREIGALLYEQPIALQPFSLQDHHGGAFTEGNLQGKWTMVFFGFTHCPDICPLTMHELAGFYRDLEGTPWQDDTQVVMISVDPFRDTTEQIAGYMAGFHDDFVGVNGDFSVISRLAREMFVSHGVMPIPDAEGNTGSNFMIDHSGNILLIGPDGHYRGFLEPNIRRSNITRAYEVIRTRG